MRIQSVHVSKLKSAPYNPRVELQEGDAEFEKLKRSIEQFDYIDPIIWNERTGYVVGGHQRLAVLKSLGREDIDVSVVDLSDEMEKALNITLNKVEGRWDDELLATLLEELSYSDVDLSLTGFDDVELDALIGDLTPRTGAEPEPFEYPEANLDDAGISYQEQYGVIVMATNEAEQQKVFNRLTAEGYQCKVVVV